MVNEIQFIKWSDIFSIFAFLLRSTHGLSAAWRMLFLSLDLSICSTFTLVTEQQSAVIAAPRVSHILYIYDTENSYCMYLNLFITVPAPVRRKTTKLSCTDKFSISIFWQLKFKEKKKKQQRLSHSHGPTKKFISLENLNTMSQYHHRLDEDTVIFVSKIKITVNKKKKKDRMNRRKFPQHFNANRTLVEML